MAWSSLLLAAAAAAFATWALSGMVRRALVRWRVLDTPNARSSHARPIPRGGGLALVPVIIAAWLVSSSWGGGDPRGMGLVAASAAFLAAVSWVDDVRGLPVVLRLAAQAGAIALILAGLVGKGMFFQGILPPTLDILAAGLLWLWFVNLFNFMDGIDGISGVETIVIGSGLVLVGILAEWPAADLAPPALIAGAAFGFLAWNWAPARIFLGDVGSIPLGFLLGWLLLRTALAGEWAAALILPLYYLADASLTLAKRAVRGERIWVAHREHLYQRAARGAGHARVALAVLACGLALIACAGAAALGYVSISLALAVAALACLLGALERMARRAVVSPPHEMR